MPNKFYHVSKRWFATGTILTPAEERNAPVHQSGHTERAQWVFLSTNRIHHTAAAVAVMEDWFVYEVKPRDTIHSGQFGNEYVTKRAEVVRYLGRAKKWYEKHGRRREALANKPFRRSSDEPAFLNRTTRAQGGKRVSNRKIRKAERAFLRRGTWSKDIRGR